MILFDGGFDMNLHLPLTVLIAISSLTLLIFVLVVCKLYNFFNEFEMFKRKNDTELNSLVWHVKKEKILFLK